MIVRKPIKHEQNKQVARKGPDGRWLPGHSGNPKGRPPREFSIAHILRKVGKEEMEVDGVTMPRREHWLRKVYENAIKGEAWASTFTAERTEGKVTQVYREEGGLSAYRNLTDEELDRALDELEARTGELAGGEGT